MSDVSIIIPAGRGDRIKQHFNSILEQDYPKEKMEVIVVSPTYFETENNVRFVKTEQLFYPGKMRNMGAKTARGDYLLFLDDDCEPLSGWVKANIELLKNEEVGAVSGMILSDRQNFANKLFDFSNFDLCLVNKPCERVLCSATFGIRKKVFEEAGGFDESLRTVEDNDLCLRLNKFGYKTVYDPVIKVLHHHDRKSFINILRYMYFGGYHSNIILISRYPDFSLTSRIFSKCKHPLFYLFMVLPMTILNISSCLYRNFREHHEMVLLLPFIFIAKLSYHLGVLSALLQKKNAE